MPHLRNIDRCRLTCLHFCYVRLQKEKKSQFLPAKWLCCKSVSLPQQRWFPLNLKRSHFVNDSKRQNLFTPNTALNDYYLINFPLKNKQTLFLVKFQFKFGFLHSSFFLFEKSFLFLHSSYELRRFLAILPPYKISKNLMRAFILVYSLTRIIKWASLKENENKCLYYDTSWD